MKSIVLSLGIVIDLAKMDITHYNYIQSCINRQYIINIFLLFCALEVLQYVFT